MFSLRFRIARVVMHHRVLLIQAGMSPNWRQTWLWTKFQRIPKPFFVLVDFDNFLLGMSNLV
jgi:hypothetical protein